MTGQDVTYVTYVTYSAALGAGLLSFFMPCVLPLIPAYFTFLTGYSLDELTREPDAKIRWNTFFSALAFVFGFSVIFMAWGAAASYLRGLLPAHFDTIRIVGGHLIVLFGCHMTGLIHIPALDFEKRIHLHKKPAHLFGAFIVGMTFGAGWSPCVGPILSSILVLASEESVVKGTLLLSVYSAGLGIPFLILSLFAGILLTFIKKAARALKYVNVTAGILLIVFGLLLIMNKLHIFIS